MLYNIISYSFSLNILLIPLSALQRLVSEHFASFLLCLLPLGHLTEDSSGMVPPLTLEELPVASFIWHFSLCCLALGLIRDALCVSPVYTFLLYLWLSSFLLVKNVLWVIEAGCDVRLVPESKCLLDVCGQSSSRSIWNRGLENVGCHPVRTSSEMRIVSVWRPALSTR